MNRVKIFTTDKTLANWSSLSKKLRIITKALNTAQNANFDVTVEYIDVIPKVVDERIDRVWFNTLSDKVYKLGYDFVGLHMSYKQHLNWGIQPTLRGLAFGDDNDPADEFYFWADENTKRNGLNQFVETCLHELRHLLCRGTNTLDDTHYLHNDLGRSMTTEFKKFDMDTYRVELALKRKIRRTLLERIADLYTQLLAKQAEPSFLLHDRLPYPYNEYISQEYGVANPIYPKTGRHIGIDYACPVGTPIYAPWDGEVVLSGYSDTLGNYCYFKYTFQGKVRVERNLHLKDKPAIGKFKAGEVIAYSGNTGAVEGNGHYHVDGWWDAVNITDINPDNWDTLTYNPKI